MQESPQALPVEQTLQQVFFGAGMRGSGFGSSAGRGDGVGAGASGEGLRSDDGLGACTVSDGTPSRDAAGASDRGEREHPCPRSSSSERLMAAARIPSQHTPSWRAGGAVRAAVHSYGDRPPDGGSG